MMNRVEQAKFDRIPKCLRERVWEVEDDRGEDNGWWIHMVDGWITEPGDLCHSIHEDTWSECIVKLKEAVPESEYIFKGAGIPRRE